MRCEHCGGIVAKGDRFCPTCGEPLKAAVTVLATPAPPRDETGRETRPDGLPATVEREEPPSSDGKSAPPKGKSGARRGKGGRKAVAAAVAVLVVVIVGAFAWAFAAGPLQPVEKRAEGSMPNVARAMTMWQDADKVRATLGVSDDEAESFSKDALLYYPGDLQGYDGWKSLYIDTTQGPSGGKGDVLDEVWLGLGGGEPKSTFAVVQEGVKIKMYSAPAYSGTYGTGSGAQNPYTFVGDLGDAQSAKKNQQAPALDGPTIAGLENALLQTGDKASYARGFSSNDARSLLESLGFPEEALAEDSSVYFRKSLGTATAEAISGLGGDQSSSGGPMQYGYRWRGTAQVGGSTVYLAVDAMSGTTVSLLLDQSSGGFRIPAQYLLTPYSPSIVVRCTFDDGHYKAWGEVEEGLERSDQPFKTDVELSIEKNGDKAGVGTVEKDANETSAEEEAPAEAFVGKWYLKWFDDQRGDQEYILEVGEPAQSDGVNAGQSQCTVLRRGDGALFHGIWGYNPEGFEFEGRTYPCLFQLFGDKECRLYMDISEDRQKLHFIREDNHAEASWLSYG